jgi:NAD+ synthase
MSNNLLSIDPEEEISKIVSFIKVTFENQKIKKAIIGVSGGIDSAVSLAVLSKAISTNDIQVVYLPYFEGLPTVISDLLRVLKIPESHLTIFSIKKIVDELIAELEIPEEDLIRRGNIMARVRMITLFDKAKKNKALVVGTENRSEHFLGYFTRFGDAASDIEPLEHLYKTQIYELAKYLKIPKEIISKPPSADLWKGQTDEAQFRFTYQEADVVLYLHFDKKISVLEIEKQGFKHTGEIIELIKKNSYKHKVPYSI